MFSWLFPATCPVPPDRQRWLERSLNWLYGEFGKERMLARPMILPTPDFFPEPFDGTRQSLEPLFARVCRYMEIDRQRIYLRVYDDEREIRSHPFAEGRSEGAAGTYERSGSGRETIHIAASKLKDPTSLVATMAHELGHAHLLGDNRLSSDFPDHEPMTDLLTVVFGMGIFNANSVISESHWQSGNMAGWSVGKLGYLFGPEYAYAFALIAKARNEASPAWLKHLRLDVRSACKQGIRFLARTSDGLFQPAGEPSDELAFERNAAPSGSGADLPVNELPWSRSRPSSSDEADDDRLDRLPWEK